MRTTLDIAPDVLELARHEAEARKVSLGRVISDLARKGAAEPALFTRKNGFPVFVVPEGTRIFGLEDIQRAQDEEDAEYAAAFHGHPSRLVG